MSTDGILLFTNGSGQASSGNGYVAAEFEDVSLAPSNNTGFSSTVSKNPLGDFFANDLAPKWQSKTLYIQDLIKIDDRTQWINGRPTYRIVWSEQFPGANGYVAGNIVLGGDGQYKYLDINAIGDVFGVAGAIQNLMWIVDPTPEVSGATANSTVDGANALSVTINGFAATQSGISSRRNLYNGALALSSPTTNDIHNYQLQAVKASSLRVLGVVVYYNIPGNGVNVFPGTAYVSGNALSPIGTSLAFPPSISNFLGGIAGFFINPQGTIGYTTTLVQNISAPATGSSGTNLLAVPAGSSFPIGSAVFLNQPLGGTYLGSVTNVSGNNLTMSATLTFGISQTLNIIFQAGPSFSISSTLSEVVMDYMPARDTSPAFIGASGYPLDGMNLFAPPDLKWRVWGFSAALVNGFSQGWGLSAINVGQTSGLLFLAGATHSLTAEGLFNAMEAEFLVGSTFTLAASITIDGCAVSSWSESNGASFGGPGLIRRVVFANAGVGFHSARFNLVGSTNVLLTRLRGYMPVVTNGQTNGLLATIPIGQTFIGVGFTGASGIVFSGVTSPSFGPIQRFYSDSFIFKGTGWTMAPNATNGSAPGGLVTYSTNVGDTVTFTYYGQQFNLAGWCGATFGLTLDGVTLGLGAGATMCTWLGTGTTTAFHKVVLTVQTATIGMNLAAVDIINPEMQLTNRQNFTPFFPAAPNTFLAGPAFGITAPPAFRPLATPDFIAPTAQSFSAGATYVLPVAPRKPLWLRIRAVAPGGGGSGSGTAAGTAAGSGGNTVIGLSMIILSGGAAGAFQGQSAPGGTAVINGMGNFSFSRSVPGGNGAPYGGSANSTTTYMSGGQGGSTPFGPGGQGGLGASAGEISSSEGGGGGGGGMNGGISGANYAGTGGGAGAYAEVIWVNPPDFIPIAIGSVGSAGGAGTSGSAGGAGGPGKVVIEEHYQ